MARRQPNQLFAAAGKEWVPADDERIGPLPYQRREGAVDLLLGTGITEE